MMYSDKTELRSAANWQGVKAGSRESLMEQLQGFTPPSLLPTNPCLSQVSSLRPLCCQLTDCLIC